LMHAADELSELLECSYRRLDSAVVSDAQFAFIRVSRCSGQDAAQSDDGHVQTRQVVQAPVDSYTRQQ